VTASPSTDAPPRPWVTYALIAANAIAFAIELAAGASPIGPTPQKLVDLGGNFGVLTLHGEWWRLGTAMFLHAGVLHIGINMACLWQGRIVESIFGKAGMIAIYLMAGLVGGLATLARSPEIVSVGASGAIFGVFGAFGAVLWLRRSNIPPEVWHRTVRGMGTFLGLNLVIGLSVPQIDMSAHIGGLIGGGAAGALLLVGRRSAAQRILRSIGLVVLALGIAAAGVLTLPAPDDPTAVLADVARIERQCGDAADDIDAKVRANHLTDAQAADRMEREVLPPWRTMRAELDTIHHPPTRVAPLIAAMRRYVAAQQAAWEALVAALRTSSADKTARIAEWRQKKAAAARAGEALGAEYARLGASK